MILTAAISFWVWEQSDVAHAFMTYGYVPAHPSVFTAVSSLFVHSDIVHLGGNLLLLWIVGDNIEDSLGSMAHVAIYLLSGVVGCMVHGAFAVGPASEMPLIGASGAISGMLGVYVFLFPKNMISVVYWVGFFVGKFRISARWAIVYWLFEQLLYFSLLGSASAVAFGAHLGGFGVGFVVGGAIRAFQSDWALGQEKAPVFWATREKRSRRDPPVQPKAPRTAVAERLERAIAGGQQEAVADLYQEQLCRHGRGSLEPDLQRKVATALRKNGFHRLAAQAIRTVIDQDPSPAVRARSEAALGELHATHLGEPGQGLSHILKAQHGPLDDSTRARVVAIQKKIESHLDRILPDHELDGTASVIRQTVEVMHPGRYGRLVAEVTGENGIDVARRLRGARGWVAEKLPVNRALSLASKLQSHGMPVLVVDDDYLVDFPNSRSVKTAFLLEQGVRLQMESGDEEVKLWGDLYLALATWVHTVDLLARQREKALGSRMAAGPFEGDLEVDIGIAPASHSHRFRVPFSLRSRFSSVQEQAVLDFFCFNPWTRYRLWEKRTTFRVQGKKVGIRMKSWVRKFLVRVPGIRMNEGVPMLADRGNRQRVTFRTERDQDSYCQWILQLEEHDRM
jgi:membrane associated rhomboid family serine protease